MSTSGTAEEGRPPAFQTWMVANVAVGAGWAAFVALLVPPYITEATGSASKAGVVMAMMSLAAVLGPVLGGIADRYDAHRQVMVGGLAAMTFALLAFGVAAGDSEFQIVDAVIMGVGLAGVSAVAPVFIVSAGLSQQLQARRLTAFNVAFPAGQVAGGMLMAVAAQAKWTFDQRFYLGAAVMALLTVVVFFTSAKPTAAIVHDDEDVADDSDEVAETRRSGLGGVIFSLFGVYLLVLVLSSIANNGVNNQIANILPNVYGISETTTSSLISLAGLLNIALFFVVGKVMTKYGALFRDRPGPARHGVGPDRGRFPLGQWRSASVIVRFAGGRRRKGDDRAAEGMTRRQSARRLAVLTGLILALLVGTTASPAHAGDIAKEEPDAARELAQRYAPVMMLKAQEQDCDPDGEPYGPTPVDIVLDNPEIVLRQLGPGDPVIKNGPTASDLFGLGRGFFIDFPGSALQPGCLYEADFNKYSSGLPAAVYAHVVQQDDHPDQLALQYWFYWYYNDWNNKHESDWEGIQLLFDASTADEALEREPVSIGYAQHEGGESADWDASKLERDGSRPFVYPSAGSHASYFGSAHYLGRSGGEGFGCDVTDGPSERVDPEVVLLPDSVDDPDDSLAWLAFDGRWGERQSGPFNGPTGPAAKGRWLEPIDWHEDLRSSSVAVPGGDSQGAAVVSAFCGVVEWGSNVLISFTTSPLRLVISVVLAVLVLSWAAGRTDWSQVPFRPLRRRRRAGQIIRLALASYAKMPGVLVTFGLAYVPAAAVAALLGAFVAIVPLVKDAIGLVGRDHGMSIGLALIAGGIPQLLGLVAITAMMSVFLDRADADEPLSTGSAARLAWSRRRALSGGLLRATAIVLGLFITVIGTPWAIRQLVRYQFMAPAVMLEDLDGKASLARSTDLVRGRWWHTGVFVALLNAVVIGVNLLVGVVLLVIFSGLPLWVFSALVTLVYGLVVPVTSVALTLLYGDAVAEKVSADDRELVPA